MVTRGDNIAPETLGDLGWPAVAEALANRCGTERGAASARQLTLAGDRAEAEARLGLISELRALGDHGHTLGFGGITDVRIDAERAAKGTVLDPEALWGCAEAAHGLHRLRARGVEHPDLAPRLAAIASEMPALEHVAKPIFDALTVDGEIVDSASQNLGSLRRRAADLASDLAARARAFASDPALATSLRDRYVTEREGRLVVPVRSDSRGNVRGIVHGASQSGNTLFVEPEALVDAGNQLKVARIAVADEEARILAQLSATVGEAAAAIGTALDIATRLDVAMAGAKLADDTGASRFEFSDGQLELIHLRHPLILLANKPCVANDVRARAGAALLISGPNAGGKTVAMTAAGLAAVMARMGLCICADRESKVPWLVALGTDIGDRQSLESDLSTFSAHVLKLREICARARPGMLVLVDEIGAGTDPDQGSALAQAALETLANAGATVIATTHAQRLKAMAASDPRFDNAAVGFDMSRMEPTFALHLGVPGASGALMLARRMGLPESVCARAEEILGEAGASVEAMAAELAEARVELARERAELAAAREALESERSRAQEAKRRARDAEAKAQKGAYAEAVAALRAARDDLARARADLRASARRGKHRAENLARVDQRIDGIAREMAAHAPAPAALSPADPDELYPGRSVRVGSFRRTGVVISRPERGRVAVQVGTMRTQVAVSDVALATPSGRKRGEVSQSEDGWSRRQHARWGESPRPERGEGGGEGPPTIDLRGERADDARRRVDEFLDRAVLDERETVFIIHGHGTGALRQALRSHVSDHPLVARWRAGEPGEGGDGVTVVWTA